MGMVLFGSLFPEVAERETRTIKVYEALPVSDARHLPVDDYGFVEFYCDERGCDCRRVMVNVVSRQSMKHVATINHAFEKPAKHDLVPDQTFLDPLNVQSSLSEPLLRVFVDVALADEEYRQRLVRHYRMFKNVVDDPAHPAHRLLRQGGAAWKGSTVSPVGKGRSIPPPPPRGGKRKKWR